MCERSCLSGNTRGFDFYVQSLEIHMARHVHGSCSRAFRETCRERVSG